jgi:CO/xanthine dehydrogenase Mo-binding subunit
MKAGNFDPLECYKKNYVSDGDVYTWRDGRQWKAHSVNYVKAMDAVAEKFGWKYKWKGWGIPTWTSEDGNKVRGVGCGIIGNSDVGEDNNEVYVRVAPDLYGDGVHVTIHADITESGMGQRSNVVKMAADSLNIPYENISIVQADSTINPTGMGLCGSRGTITYGHAVCNACDDVKEKIFKAAEPLLEVCSDAMEIEDFCVVSHARPGKKIPIKQLTNQFMSFTGYGRHIENFSTPNFYIIFVEVEIDKETGKLDIKRIVGERMPDR